MNCGRPPPTPRWPSSWATPSSPVTTRDTWRCPPRPCNSARIRTPVATATTTPPRSTSPEPWCAPGSAAAAPSQWWTCPTGGGGRRWQPGWWIFGRVNVSICVWTRPGWCAGSRPRASKASLPADGERWAARPGRAGSPRSRIARSGAGPRQPWDAGSMTNLDTKPSETLAKPAGLYGPRLELYEAREVPLGGIRSITVHRTLPQRHLPTVGAWCFLDQFGPDEGPPMRVLPHPHTGLQTVTWPIRGQIRHRDSLGNDLLVKPGQLDVMTAGRGIAHSVFSEDGDGICGWQFGAALHGALRAA